MPCITLQIDPAFGPIIEIGIALPASTIVAGAPKPPISWVKALGDTGCSHTSIHASVATALSLQIVGKANAHTGGGATANDIYHGDLFLRVPLANNQVFEFPFRDRQFLELKAKLPAGDALLGMDILGLGTFHVNGITKNAMLCW
jgi:hypothetical protein